MNDSGLIKALYSIFTWSVSFPDSLGLSSWISCAVQWPRTVTDTVFYNWLNISFTLYCCHYMKPNLLSFEALHYCPIMFSDTILFLTPPPPSPPNLEQESTGTTVKFKWYQFFLVLKKKIVLNGQWFVRSKIWAHMQSSSAIFSVHHCKFLSKSV